MFFFNEILILEFDVLTHHPRSDWMCMRSICDLPSSASHASRDSEREYQIEWEIVWETSYTAGAANIKLILFHFSCCSLILSDPDWIHSNNKYLENYVIKISIKIFNRFFSTFLCSTLFPPPPVLYPPPIQQLAACTSIRTSRNKCETNKSINFLHLNHLGPNKLWKYTM